MRPEQIVAALVAGRLTVATAESLTGGLVCAALTAVPGASAVVRGGVVAYATDVKSAVLGVDADVLRRHGAVSRETAAAMAVGVRSLLSADVGIATTGVAGPDRQDGRPAGTVHVAVASAAGVDVISRDDEGRLSGDRAAIRRQVVDLAMAALGVMLGLGES